MASNRWKGAAGPVAQVFTITVTVDDATTTYSVTMNNKVVSIKGSGSGTSTTASNLQAALAASTYPEFQEVTWTVATTVVTGTGPPAGTPFTASASVSGGTGAVTTATPTAATSPNHWSNVNNWSAGVVPQSTLSAPVQSNPSATSGGSLSNGTTYFWVITALNANGETVVSNEKSLAITAPNQTAALSWGAVNNAMGYKVYRSTSSGVYGATSLVTTIGSGTTVTYSDTGTATVTGQPPVSSTAIGDDVYLDQSSVDVLYDIAQSTVTLNSLNIAASFTGHVGLPEVNANGTSSYEEYRQRYLALGATTANIGYGEGQGSPRINWDAGATQTNAAVRQTGTSEVTGLEALLFKGTNASNVLEVTRGSVAIAGYGGESATLATLRVGYVTSQDSDAQVRCGAGCTVTTLNMLGGTVLLNTGPTTTTKAGGDLTIQGTSAVGTLTNDSGAFHYLGSGTITTYTGGIESTFERTADIGPCTVTNCTLQAGATLSDPFGQVTFSTGIRLSRCRVGDVTLDVGFNRLVTPS